VAQQKLNDAHEGDQNFYQGKLATMRYFYEYELVKVDSLVKRLQSTDNVTIEMQSDWF
jgi:butyryl-CoA dehydrogenase